MKDVSLITHMLLNIEPEAQKPLFELIEIIYRRNSVPEGLNVFDGLKDIESSGFIEPSAIDTFDEEIEQPKKVASKILKESEDDFEDFIQVAEDYKKEKLKPEEKVTKVQEIKSNPSYGYCRNLLKDSNVSSEFLSNFLKNKEEIVNMAIKVKEKFNELALLQDLEVVTLAEKHGVDVESATSLRILRFHLASKILGYW